MMMSNNLGQILIRYLIKYNKLLLITNLGRVEGEEGNIIVVAVVAISQHHLNS